MYKKDILSPVLAKLQNDITNRKSGVVEGFWRNLEAKGTPIFEKIEGDDENYIVTIVWRQTREINNIFVFGEIFGGEMFGEKGKKTNLQRLLDTDIWYISAVGPRNSRSLYILVANVDDEYEWNKNDVIVDPLNPKTYETPVDEEHPEDCPLLNRVESVIEFPDVEEKVWIKDREDGKKGKIEMIRFKSEILNNERRIWIYTPYEYSKMEKGCGLAVFTDGWEYVNLVKAPEIIDNLIADGYIPPVCAVFMESLQNRSEELTFNDGFLEFVVDEVLNYIKLNYNIVDDQSKTVLAGLSLGGLFAAYGALRYPHLFGKVLSQSGAFYYRVGKDGKPEADMEGKCWIAEEYLKVDKLPVDFYMNIGVFEEIFNYHVRANNCMADALKDKGYSVTFERFPGGHVYVDWQDNLANGFKVLFQEKAL